MLDPLYQGIGWLLAFFYSVVPPHNLGLSIILLTCTVMLILFPLTAKQARSMIAMQKVQPEIKRIQQQYKDDRQKQNEEVMKFYQEHKINPLSGCLPLLMQMPIFISLFNVLRNIGEGDNIPTSGAFDRLYEDIQRGSQSATMFLGMDLSVSPLDATGGFLETLPYFVLVGLVVLTGWYQTRQTMARQKNSSTPANPQMQIIGKVMPIFLGVVSLNFVSGLVLYFASSNSWRIGQQQLVLNKIYEEEHAKPGPGSKAQPDDAVDTSSRDVTGGGSDDQPRTKPAGSPSRGSDSTRPKKGANPNTSRKKRKKRKR